MSLVEEREEGEVMMKRVRKWYKCRGDEKGGDAERVIRAARDNRCVTMVGERRRMGRLTRMMEMSVEHLV